jgi:hypothetical protein
LYGTWVISIAAIDFRSSALRCEIVPLPCDAMFSRPGRWRACAISSSSVDTASPGVASSTFGYAAMMPIGTNFSGSKESL